VEYFNDGLPQDPEAAVAGTLTPHFTPNNDAPSRHDIGVEFLDVTEQVNVVLIASNRSVDGQQQEDVYGITNNGSSIVDTDLLMVAQGLSEQIEMTNASGMTSAGDPYRSPRVPARWRPPRPEHR